MQLFFIPFGVFFTQSSVLLYLMFLNYYCYYYLVLVIEFRVIHLSCDKYNISVPLQDGRTLVAISALSNKQGRFFSKCAKNMEWC